MIALQNYEKWFLFRNRFCFLDIQIFVIFSFPLPHFSDLKGQVKVENLWSYEWTCID